VTTERWDEELLLPPDTSGGAATARLREALAGHRLQLAESGRKRSRRIYLDSFDARLDAAGMTAVHVRDGDSREPGSLVVVGRDGGELAVADPFPVPDGPLLAFELAPGPLREALGEIVDVRALLPLVEVDSELVDYVVLDDERKTVVRLQLEQPALVGQDGADAQPLRPRLRLQEIRGYASERRRVAAAARELGFAGSRHRLRDEAVLAAGGSPGGTSAKVAVELIPSQRSDAAAVAVLRRLAEVIEDNLDGTIADLDAEFLHDLRVAVRRSRAVQRELRPVFPAEAIAHFRAEFKWLQGVTGPARDLDVYVLEFDAMRELIPPPMRPDLDPVLRVLRERRLAARRTMVRELRSGRMAELRRDWEGFLEELVALPTEDRPEAELAISELAGQRIRKVYRRIRRMGEAIDEDSPSEDYHDIRKQGKELRYLLELFGRPLFDDAVVGPMIKALKRLQDVLGRHQDREVQRHTLRELADAVAAQPGRTGALMAMGVLVERLYEDELAARAEFAEPFAAFTAKGLRKQVKDTFQ
jgi:CHAD domain-containing protein